MERNSSESIKNMAESFLMLEEFKDKIETQEQQ